MPEVGCMRFKDRVAMVTGAASGIGAATARRLADEGASLVLTDRDGKGVEEVCRSLPHVERHIALRHDITVEQEWLSALDSVKARHGRLDVLVNNAGWSRNARIADTSLEDWRAIIAVNLDGAFLGIKHAMPLLAASGRGAIVNLSSIRSYVAAPGTAPYCAAKSGVRMLTKVAAIECSEAGNGVRVNSIHPGYVKTRLSAGVPEERIAQLATTVPVRRLAEAAEIAAAIAFLASDDASYMTGSELVVDGALTAL